MPINPIFNDYLADVVRDPGQKFVGVTTNAANTLASIPVVYGYRQVNGIRVFTSCDQTDSRILYAVYALSEGYCDSFDKMYINDLEVDISNITLQDIRNGVISNVTLGRFAGILSFQFINGSRLNATYAPSGIATMLSSAFGSSNSPSYNNLCYLVCKFTLTDSNSPYRDLPKVSINLFGRRLRKLVSSGGDDITTDSDNYGLYSSGSHYSYNPAVVLYDLLTHPRYGKAFTNSQLDLASFQTAETYFNTTITYGPNLSGPTNSCNYILDTSRSLFENIKTLLKSYLITMTFVNGKYRIGVEKGTVDDLTIPEFNNSTLFGDVTVAYPDASVKYNKVIVEYVEPNLNWGITSVQYPPVGDTQFLDADGGRVLELRVTMTMITSGAIARNIAETLLRKSRNQTLYRFNVLKQAHEVRVGDVVSLVNAFPLLQSQTVRIISMQMNDDYTFAIEAVKHDESYYAPFDTTFRQSITVRPVKPSLGGPVIPSLPPSNPGITPPNPGQPISPTPPPAPPAPVSTLTLSGGVTLSGGQGSNWYQGDWNRNYTSPAVSTLWGKATTSWATSTTPSVARTLINAIPDGGLAPYITFNLSLIDRSLSTTKDIRYVYQNNYNATSSTWTWGWTIIGPDGLRYDYSLNPESQTNFNDLIVTKTSTTGAKTSFFGSNLSYVRSNNAFPATGTYANDPRGWGAPRLSSIGDGVYQSTTTTRLVIPIVKGNAVTQFAGVRKPQTATRCPFVDFSTNATVTPALVPDYYDNTGTGFYAKKLRFFEVNATNTTYLGEATIWISLRSIAKVGTNYTSSDAVCLATTGYNIVNLTNV